MNKSLTEKSVEEGALEADEASKLAEILADGFAIYGSIDPSTNYDISALVYEPFFGATASGGGYSPPHEPSLVGHMRKEGYTDEEVADELENYLDDLVSEDAPDWRSTTPFGFSLRNIRPFFER